MVEVGKFLCRFQTVVRMGAQQDYVICWYGANVDAMLVVEPSMYLRVGIHTLAELLFIRCG